MEYENVDEVIPIAVNFIRYSICVGVLNFWLKMKAFNTNTVSCLKHDKTIKKPVKSRDYWTLEKNPLETIKKILMVSDGFNGL